MHPDDPRAEDELVERIVLAQLRGEPVDLDAELRGLPAEFAATVRRRVDAVASIRRVARAIRDDDVALPDRLGEFVLEDEIARGGMGIVFRAFQPALKRHVALKILPRLAAADERRVERFVREAASLGRLEHPGIVPVLSAGEVDGVLYFAMPIVEGCSLSAILAAFGDQPAAKRVMDVVARVMANAAPNHSVHLPESYVEFVARVVAQAADALAYAHEKGVLHRDIKPGNLMVTPDGRVRIIDFGLVRLTDSGESLTRSQEVLGTVAYLAPEEVDGDTNEPTERSDVYSLGVVLYEALAGAWPFSGQRASGVIERIRSTTPAPLIELHPGIPRDLETICHKAIERDPHRRYASAGEFREDLERFLRFEPIVATRPGPATRIARHLRRRPRIAAGVAGIVLLAVLAVGLVVIDAARERARRRAACEEFLGFADSTATELEHLRAESKSLVRERNELESLLQSRYIDDEERTRLSEARIAVERCRSRFRELTLAASAAEPPVAEAARGVDGPLAASVEAAILRLVEIEWQDAVDRGDEATIERCLQRIGHVAPDDVADDRFVAAGDLTIDSPRDGDVWMFRYLPLRDVRPDAHSSRWVPVPCDRGGTPLLDECFGVRPGQACLAVLLEDAEHDLRLGDLITAIDGIPVSSGYWVRGVREDGPAMAAGVRPWERIESLGGRSVTSWADIRHAVYFGESRLDLVTRDRTNTHTVSIDNDEPRGTVFADAAGIEFSTARELLAGPSLVDRSIQLQVARDGVLGVRNLGAGSEIAVRSVDTVYPLITTPGSQVGVFDSPIRLPAGEYLVLFRTRDGRESRFPVSIANGTDHRIAHDLPAATPPPGDVVWIPTGTLDRPVDPRAPGSLALAATRVEGFFVDRFETTLGQWMEFVEDAEVAAEAERIRAESGRTAIVPRYEDGVTPRRFGQPMSFLSAARWVDFSDVERFVAWRNATLERIGSRWRARLPSTAQWERAAGSSMRRVFPWGDRFEPGLTLYQYTWPVTFRMPIGSMPGDESPHGVRDLAGSVCEWLREPWPGIANDFQATAGASYAYTWRDAFRVQSRSAEARNRPNNITGIRLVYEAEP